MPQPPLTDEECIEGYELYKQHGSFLRAGLAIGKDDKFIARRAKEAARRGLVPFDPVMPGFRVAGTTHVMGPDGDVRRVSVQQRPEGMQTEVVPPGHRVKGVSTYLTPDGPVGQWVKTDNQPDPVQIADEIFKKLSQYNIKYPLEPPSPFATAKASYTLYPVSDWHLGLLAWGPETYQNWDLKIAEERLKVAMYELMQASPPSHTATILGLGDFTHTDNKNNVTERSRNSLDVDGRYEKVAMKACEIAEWLVLTALEKHQVVEVRFLPGNHDEYTALIVMAYLSGLFKDHDRVQVDLRPGGWWTKRHGDNFLVATHGHKIKPAAMPGFVSARWRKEWGLSRFVHGFMGHFHHHSKPLNDDGGMTVEMMPAPIPPDAFHHDEGYFSGRSVGSYSYDRTKGLSSQNTRMLF